ncbi:hypothetical protein WJX72_001870 [[Myrmecia] bisecta]|uniref:Peptidase M50 domain-containing protein n=1 Tax=[Myrmecia] bisecta TaxID=41462 RepID=A0AAW1PM76_9CHLO
MSEESDDRMKATVASLDALLGIEEEPKEELPASSKNEEQEEPRVAVELAISDDVLKQIAAMEAGRKRKGQPSGGRSTEEIEKELRGSMANIVEQAKKLAENADKKGGEQALQGEFENLLSLLKPDSVLSKEDIQKLKDEVFGQTTFWVTETRTVFESVDTGGLLVRGNLRAPREKVFDEVADGVKRIFGDKYEVLMIEDPEAEEEDPRGGPRIAFQILPAEAAQPNPTAAWQILVAGVLLILTVGSATQLGLTANVSKLPKETIEWLAKPSELGADQLPPGLVGWDPLPYFLSALPITASVLLLQLVHDVMHRVTAAQKKIKLGPSLFIPNGQIGSFGAITPFKSLVRSRRDLFDVSFSGPAAAALASLALFGYGLLLSAGGDVPKEALVPVPAQLFQGSLLLGSTAKLVLGDGLARSVNVLIHPFLIGGWCGMVSTAFNLLPVGALDGGRMMQAAFGRNALAISSFFVYVGLGLGFLGSSLALPFGLYVLICQRNAEKYVQDAVTPAGERRQGLAVAAFLLALLVLLPMAPDVADSVGVGAQSMFL